MKDVANGINSSFVRSVTNASTSLSIQPKGKYVPIDRKVIESQREWFIMQLVSTNYLERLFNEIGKLKGKEYIKPAMELLEFAFPKLSRVEVKNDFNADQLNKIESLAQSLSKYAPKDLEEARRELDAVDVQVVENGDPGSSEPIAGDPGTL